MDDNAKEQVEAFLRVLHERYGLNDDDVRDFIAILVRLRGRFRTFGRLGEFTAQAVIYCVVAAIFAGAGWSFIHFIQWVTHK